MKFFETLFEILLIIFGLACPWLIWNNIKDSIGDIRKILHCTDIVTAQILSWRLQEYADESDAYYPMLQYTYNGLDYQSEFIGGCTNKKGKARYDAEGTMNIRVCSEDPSFICHENRGLVVFSLVGGHIIMDIIFLLFFLFALVSLYVHFF